MRGPVVVILCVGCLTLGFALGHFIGPRAEVLPSSETTDGKLTVEDAIRIAWDTARKHEYRMDDYLVKAVTFDPEKDGLTVSFDHKPPSFPGGQFWVLIDRETRLATVRHGF